MATEKCESNGKEIYNRNETEKEYTQNCPTIFHL